MHMHASQVERAGARATEMAISKATEIATKLEGASERKEAAHAAQVCTCLSLSLSTYVYTYMHMHMSAGRLPTPRRYVHVSLSLHMCTHTCICT